MSNCKVFLIILFTGWLASNNLIQLPSKRFAQQKHSILLEDVIVSCSTVLSIPIKRMLPVLTQYANKF